MLRCFTLVLNSTQAYTCPIWYAPPSLVAAKKVSGLVPSPLTDERFNTVSVK